MKNLLSTLTIKRRILLSFTLIVIVSVLFAFFNIYSLRQFYHQLNEYKQVSDDASLMLKIDSDLSELRRLIVIFSHNNQIASIADLKALHQKMRVDIDDVIKQHKLNNHADVMKLKQMQASVNSFGEKFETLDKQRNLRDDFINHQLFNSFTSVNYEMTLLSKKVGSQENKRLIKDFWEAQLAISKAESISADYFNSRLFTKKTSVQTQLSLAESKLTKALSHLKNQNITENVRRAINLVHESQTVFNQAAQADRNYLFLLNIVIAGESAELSILSEQLKIKSLSQQQDIYASTEKGIARNANFAIYLSIVSMVIAFMVAFIIGRFISSPLATITETLTSLTKGQQISHIPGIERQDEIGQLARAANVFNQNNLQTKKLLREAETLTQNLELREDELERKNEDLKSFTHIASHDLKSPIQGISDLTLWVEEDLGDAVPEEVKSNLAKIRVRIHRMQNLIDDLLKYSQFGMVSEDRSMIDVPTMINEILEIVMMPPAFSFNVNGEIPPFECFKTPLQTTIRNVLSNAIKHHDKADGIISINLAEKEEYYTFEVQDNGAGIKEEDQENIFMLFKTGSNKDKKSTGMGLAFCKRMVETHGGQIEVESVVGQGTIFRIYWPKTIKESMLTA